MEQNLLEAQDLKIYYRTPTVPVKAVDGINLVIKEKEILGLAGESGCGKSTLANGIIRMIYPPAYFAGGKVLFHGQDLLKMSEEEIRQVRWKKIAFSPQASMNSLNPVIKIISQMQDVMEDHDCKKPKQEIRDFTSKIMKSVGLSPQISDGYACELSGGMKQRVIISMGMTLNPELIIADEPTSSLDVVVQRGVLELLVELKERQGTSVLLVSHDLGILAEVVDRLAIIYAGKILEIQDVYKIFSEPLNPYTQGLISSIPTFEKQEIPQSIHGLPPNLMEPPLGCRFHPRCPKAMSICKEKEPELKEIDSGNFVACHLF